MSGVINGPSITRGDFELNTESHRGIYAQLKHHFIREFLLAAGLITFVYAGHKFGLNSGIVLFPLTVLSWVGKKHLWQARISILVVCGGSDIVAYLYCALLMLQVFLSLYSQGLPARTTRVSTLLWFFVGLAVMSGLINQLIEVNLLALPLWVMSFLSPLGVLLYFRKYSLTENALYRFLFFLASVAILQCLVAYIDSIEGVGFGAIWSFSVTPDIVTGTFNNANKFGFLLFESLTWCYTIIFTQRLSTRAAVIAVVVGLFFMVFIFTADVKTLLGAFMMGFIIILFYNYRWQLGDRSTKLVVLVMLSALILGPAVVRFAMEKYDLVYAGYFVGSQSKKIQFIERAIDPTNRNIAHWLFGYGPGTCSSRAANMQAYDLLYKGDNSETNVFKKFIPPHSSICTKRFLADLFDWHYAETASGRSALLGNPFNSWTAIWFETGIVGFLLWGYVFITILRASKNVYQNSVGVGQQVALLTAINIIAISIVGLITQAIETPAMMMFLWFFVAHMADYPA